MIESGGTPPHSGTLVTFTTSFGTVQPSQAETDVSGRVQVKFVAGTGSGTATITALSGGVSASGNNAVKIVCGAAAVGRVIVTANPTLVPALGGTTAITAFVLDINGNPLNSVPVSFATTAGSLANSIVNADQNGQAQTTLRTAQTATVTASVGAHGSDDSGDDRRRHDADHAGNRKRAWPGLGYGHRRRGRRTDARHYAAHHSTERRAARDVLIRRSRRPPPTALPCAT